MNEASELTSDRRVLITGAGSGTGAAAALALAPSRALVLVGRRRDRLEATAARVREAGGTADVVEFDVATGDPAALLAEAGPVTDLVLAAGRNAPGRTWADQDMVEFRAIVATNFDAVAGLIAAALPSLRAASGTVVVVSSFSAWSNSPGAGVAYRASKTALRSLTETLNEQEAVHGVRASHLCPGDIDTEFIDHRPTPPERERRKRMLSAQDVARSIAFILDSPAHVRIDELVISPLGTIDR